MNKLITLLLTAFILASCAKETGNVTIKGNVEGLRKGTIYLQKVEDSTLVSIDSVIIQGKPNFEFITEIESPEVLTLYLDKNDGNNLNDRLDIFAEPGVISVQTTRDFFAPEAKVEGSASHTKWMEYKKIRSKFGSENLDLIKEILQASKDGNIPLADSLQARSDQNAKRSYLYTINFVLNNTDSYVAPYITLVDAYNVNIKYLDSISNTLSNEVAASKYGRLLKQYIKDIKEEVASSQTDRID
ncbi:DUF4369 domain-containing protein [Galbibacter sp.]|uniref:DUF4369 domain-containing protein n=1 Tax=Galbibacter sp. TaxID=2918471 RepID=UPI002CF6F183|nr:DUF4369 domain-containing protein [Galbibacter sp.]HLV62338.1 DUF4369 domain-containing protein [Galbibacter sp.]